MVRHITCYQKNKIVFFSSSFQDKPLVTELVITFDVLRNFMFMSPEVKVGAYECGLSDLLHRLWAWCQVEPQLMSAALQLLATYTARCPQGENCNVLSGAYTLKD